MGLISAVAAVMALTALGACAETKVRNDMNENWGEPVSECRIGITQAHPSRPHQIIVDIAFRNEGSVEVLLPRTSLWFDFAFAVGDEAGARVPLTPFGEQQRDNLSTAAAALVEVGPGQTYKTSVELSLLYHLDRSGSYAVQASKTFRDPANKQFVESFSNRLTIHVRRD